MVKLKSNCPVCGKEYIPNKIPLSEEVAKIIYTKTASYTRSHTNNGLVRKSWEECSNERKRSYFNAAHALIQYFKNEKDWIFHPPEPV